MINKNQKNSEAVKTLDPRSGKADTLDRARQKLQTTHHNLEIQDTNEIRKKRTSRSKLAEQYEFQDKIEKLRRTSPVNRLIAGVIDLCYAGGIIFAAQFAVPMAKKEYIKFLVSQNMNQMLDPAVLHQYLWIAVAAAALVILYILPTLMMGRSLGKSMQGQRIGNAVDGVSVERGAVFLREIILRPLSLLSVIGIALMFVTKKRQGLHDLILKTSVFSD